MPVRLQAASTLFNLLSGLVTPLHHNNECIMHVDCHLGKPRRLFLLFAFGMCFESATNHHNDGGFNACWLNLFACCRIGCSLCEFVPTASLGYDSLPTRLHAPLQQPVLSPRLAWTNAADQVSDFQPQTAHPICAPPALAHALPPTPPTGATTASNSATSTGPDAPT